MASGSAPVRSCALISGANAASGTPAAPSPPSTNHTGRPAWTHPLTLTCSNEVRPEPAAPTTTALRPVDVMARNSAICASRPTRSTSLSVGIQRPARPHFVDEPQPLSAQSTDESGYFITRVSTSPRSHGVDDGPEDFTLSRSRGGRNSRSVRLRSVVEAEGKGAQLHGSHLVGPVLQSLSERCVARLSRNYSQPCAARTGCVGSSTTK